MSDLTYLAPAVFQLEGNSLDAENFQFLKFAAARAELRRARICIHQKTTDPIQEMFVCMMKDSPKGTYYYPRPASIFLIEGAYRIEFDDGAIELNQSRPFVRIPALTYQHPVILTDHVLLHEIHTGPWSKDYVVQR